MNVPRAFVFDHFHTKFSCNFLTKDYAEIFYTIDERDVLYFQCEVSLRWPKLMREVDGPSLIFIDFNVPALTPRLN
jgi:hypothetical protein